MFPRLATDAFTYLPDEHSCWPDQCQFLSAYYLAVTRLTFMSSDSLNNHMRYFYVLHFMNEDMEESIFFPKHNTYSEGNMIVPTYSVSRA